MHAGRPPKRRKFNFNKNESPIPNLNESQDSEFLDEQTNCEAAVETTALDSNYDLPSTSGATFNNVYQTTTFNQESNAISDTSRPVRKAKVVCLDRLVGVISDLNDSQSQELAETRIYRKRNKNLNETAEERQQRLSDALSRVTHRISQENCEQRSQRLSNMRERDHQRRNAETPEERSQMLDNMRQRISQQRNEETPEERSQRLDNKRQRISQQRNEETPEVRSQRLENLRIRANEIRAAESNARREQRLEEQRRRNARRQSRLLANPLKPTYKLAIQSDVRCHCLGEFNVACVHCGALHFSAERVGNRNNNSFGDCCLKGKIDIQHADFPNELARLFSHRHPLSPEFHQRIKNLNSSYAMASYSCDDDRTINNRGIYTYIANGQVYHKINAAAQPTQTPEGNFEKPLYGQMYFLDPEEAVTERGNYPINNGISVPLFELLEEIIRSENPFVRGYMMMREVAEQAEREAALQQIPVPNVRLLFTCPEGLDPRRYNVPQSNEVCAVVTLNADQSFPDNPLIIRQRGKSVQIMKNIDKHAEPLTYPLFFPKGTFGFSPGMPLKEGYPSRGHITRLELARYRIAFRPHLAQCISLDETLRGYDLRNLKFNALHFGGRLFQQYLVDTYIRIEYDRIQWIKMNQKKILADSYTSVTNYLNEMAQKNNAVLGEKIILPSSFPGSTRYYSEHFEDAMALVRRFGSPDFFITMTCNPDWPEIKEAIKIMNENGSDWQQLAQDRPDIIARVAYLKFAELIEDLDKSQIFGQVAAYVYTIEFQKRGLPHMHLLIILKPEDKIHNPEELDDLVSAEIPDVEDDAELRELVKKWMIHQACGEQNQKASCMVNKNGRMSCRFKFPMEFQDTTSLIDDGKPKYRRRYDPKLDQNNRDCFVHEEAIYRKDAQGQKITRNNRHVAPYNSYLLKKFNCHINVEYVGSIRAVKYLYKYIYKGHDCAALKVVQNQTTINYNEADKFIQGRCITPPEACWRLFGNEIQKKSHCVQRLDIHLPGQYRVQNIEQAQEDLLDIGQKGSMLEAYFRTNQAKKHRIENNDNTENNSFYFYWQMPEFYRWEGKKSEWVERQRNIRVIGRIHNVTFVAQPELYFLRLLLYHVNDAVSFNDLLMVNGVKCNSYKQACLARGLTYDDKQWIDGLRESALSKMPRAMRTLFTQILIFGAPENPKNLWDTFKEDLAEDFIHHARENGTSVDEAIRKAYRIIAHKLNSQATEGRNFQFWVDRFQMDDIDVYDEINDDIINIDQSFALGEEMRRQLRGSQIEVVDSIIDTLDNNLQQRCFFIDGPGGTGKTFIYKTLYHVLSAKNYKVKCMAFTGIAAMLLPNGHTSHKTCGLKVPLTAESISNIKPGSAKARELAKIDIFLMDEAPMLPKYGLQNIDVLLRSIANPNLKFGGKVIVLGGDFRQCLPVQPRANRSELVNLSIKKSPLWHNFKFFSLTENMRVDPEQLEFANYLLQVGNGELPKNELDEIKIPNDMISNGDIIDEVFGNCLLNRQYENMKDRAILAPLNKDVAKINAEIIEKLEGENKKYKSYDSVKDPAEDTLQFTSEFLNSIEIADLPPHELKLKRNTIIMLLRNLDLGEGLCNGVRLTVTELCNNIIKGKIITGEHAGQEVHIPRITLESSKNQLGCSMQRHQFPVKPAFAMTIHKSQGQTFEYVGVDLRSPVFMHGMLYVAFSRVKRRNSLKILLPAENNSRIQGYTRNVVWTEVLNNAYNNIEPDLYQDEDFFLENL